MTRNTRIQRIPNSRINRRVNLSNGTWFNPDAATKFEEATRWNGNNHVSLATGSQWEHEMLYRTAKGAWVLHCWSQWQGSTPSYEIITETDANVWLIRQGHHAAVPDSVVAASEI